jgi:hypothetical protein
MLKRYMHRRERHLAMLNDNRVVRPFEWGTEFIGHEPDAANAHELFVEFSRETIGSSDEYFAIPSSHNFNIRSRPHESEPGAIATGEVSPATQRTSAGTRGTATKAPVTAAPGSDPGGDSPHVQVLTWPSAISTPSPENNTAYATYFPHHSRRAAVIVLPHWNAKAGTYFDLCKFFNKVGLSALRLTLPYHEERTPPELDRADYLVAPNVGRSLQSIRQSVADTRACISWLKEQGYEKVGIVGTSIGSCVAFLAFVHDDRLDAAVFNHVSGYMADVVWHGYKTRSERSPDRFHGRL